MGRKKKVIPEIKVEDMTVPQRNVSMFKDYLTGMTFQAIADKYGMGYDNVYRISVQYKWKDKRAEALDRAFAAAVAEVKSMSLSLTLALKRDMELVIAEALKEKRMLTKEERDHFSKLLDRFFKEARLEDGKPTDISSGTHTVELLLPPGVKRFGVIPPDPRVTLVESKEVKEEDKPIDLDEIDYDPKEIK